MYEIKVRTSRPYTITVTNRLSAFGEKAVPFLKGEKVAVVSDDNVNGLFGDSLNAFFADKTVIKIVLKHGERSKNAKNYFKIINALAEKGFSREDSVVAFGGGVIGDIAGFAASTYMRGITLISVPTTLLSAVDSSVGGKTAIDLAAGKNLCGTFFQPSAVYINTGFLKTLPKREIKNGLGEIIKYAFLSDTVSAADIERGGEELIFKCLEIKRDIVERDEYENGVRAFLNLGHTIGHALEKLSGYKLSHGLCVAKGIVYSIAVSEKLYGLTKDKTDKMFALLKTGKFDLTNPFSAADIKAQLTADKKRRGDLINFVALKDIGRPQIEKISISDLGKIIEDYDRKNRSV